MHKLKIKLALCLVYIIGSSGSAVLAKKIPLAAPRYDKLIPGAGPKTNDPGSARLASRSPMLQQATAPTVIAPVKLDEGSGVGTASNTTEPVLKSTITATGFVPKGPLDPAGGGMIIPSESILTKARKKGEITIKQASLVNVMPVPLMQSEDETTKKVETILDAEKKQLSDLWEATLTRSQDIQFVIQKLMPTSNKPHAATMLTRALNTAVFGGMGAMAYMSPNLGTMYAGQMGASMVMSMLGQVEGKAEKKARISESESVMLYNIVRATADKMVENFRDYKKSLLSLGKAGEDLAALQSMVADARSGQDAPKQVEMEYTLRKAQRDIDEKSSDVRKYRQSLVDVSGADAVDKLDRQIQEENTALAEQTQNPVPSDAENQAGTVGVATDNPPDQGAVTIKHGTSESAAASKPASRPQTASTSAGQG